MKQDTSAEDAIGVMSDELSRLGLALTQQQKDAFHLYMAELTRWNAVINLTAITAPLDIAIKHFYDSILFALGSAGMGAVNSGEYDYEHSLDIGSGAGFPGIPISMIKPRLRLTIVEKNRKKCSFLLSLISKLSLADRVSVLCKRIEDMDSSVRFHTAYIRGVKLDTRLFGFIDRLMLPGGCIVYSLGKASACLSYPGYTLHEKEFLLPHFSHPRRILTFIPDN